jgi:hypothetical protein
MLSVDNDIGMIGPCRITHNSLLPRSLLLGIFMTRIGISAIFIEVKNAHLIDFSSNAFHGMAHRIEEWSIKYIEAVLLS